MKHKRKQNNGEKCTEAKRHAISSGISSTLPSYAYRRATRTRKEENEAGREKSPDPRQ